LHPLAHFAEKKAMERGESQEELGSFFFMLQLRLRLPPQRKIEKLIFNNKIKAKSICERKNSVCIKLP